MTEETDMEKWIIQYMQTKGKAFPELQLQQSETETDAVATGQPTAKTEIIREDKIECEQAEVTMSLLSLRMDGPICDKDGNMDSDNSNIDDGGGGGGGGNITCDDSGGNDNKNDGGGNRNIDNGGGNDNNDNNDDGNDDDSGGGNITGDDGGSNITGDDGGGGNITGDDGGNITGDDGGNITGDDGGGNITGDDGGNITGGDDGGGDVNDNIDDVGGDVNDDDGSGGSNITGDDGGGNNNGNIDDGNDSDSNGNSDRDYEYVPDEMDLKAQVVEESLETSRKHKLKLVAQAVHETRDPNCLAKQDLPQLVATYMASTIAADEPMTKLVPSDDGANRWDLGMQQIFASNSCVACAFLFLYKFMMQGRVAVRQTMQIPKAADSLAKTIRQNKGYPDSALLHLDEVLKFLGLGHFYLTKETLEAATVSYNSSEPNGIDDFCKRIQISTGAVTVGGNHSIAICRMGKNQYAIVDSFGQVEFYGSIETLRAWLYREYENGFDSVLVPTPANQEQLVLSIPGNPDKSALEAAATPVQDIASVADDDSRASFPMDADGDATVCDSRASFPMDADGDAAAICDSGDGDAAAVCDSGSIPGMTAAVTAAELQRFVKIDNWDMTQVTKQFPAVQKRQNTRQYQNWSATAIPLLNASSSNMFCAFTKGRSKLMPASKHASTAMAVRIVLYCNHLIQSHIVLLAEQVLKDESDIHTFDVLWEREMSQWKERPVVECHLQDEPNLPQPLVIPKTVAKIVSFLTKHGRVPELEDGCSRRILICVRSRSSPPEQHVCVIWTGMEEECAIVYSQATQYKLIWCREIKSLETLLSLVFSFKPGKLRIDFKQLLVVDIPTDNFLLVPPKNVSLPTAAAFNFPSMLHRFTQHVSTNMKGGSSFFDVTKSFFCAFANDRERQFFARNMLMPLNRIKQMSKKYDTPPTIAYLYLHALPGSTTRSVGYTGEGKLQRDEQGWAIEDEDGKVNCGYLKEPHATACETLWIEDVLDLQHFHGLIGQLSDDKFVLDLELELPTDRAENIVMACWLTYLFDQTTVVFCHIEEFSNED